MRRAYPRRILNGLRTIIHQERAPNQILCAECLLCLPVTISLILANKVLRRFLLFKLISAGFVYKGGVTINESGMLEGFSNLSIHLLILATHKKTF